MAPDAQLVARFRADLDRLSPKDEPVGLAVSGGPDSVALLLLAHAARPGRIEAITVDHALRPESAMEASFVADLCSRLGVPHHVALAEWQEKPRSGLQEKARAERYRLIADWLRRSSMTAVCTGHHRDDQAETLLMRLARGSGVRGLAAMRPSAPLPGAADLRLLRPLLAWRHAEIVALCEAAGLTPVADPSNDEPRFERVRLRQVLASLELDAAALARSADNLRSADDAIEWAVERTWRAQVTDCDGATQFNPGDAPAEIRRRIVGRIIASLASEGSEELRGRELDQLLASLESGTIATLRGVRAEGGPTWRFRPAPPRTLACG
ncbi:MAG TPA: tRNA lysidine(34) synthetase TilS [Sphingomicrobium sp.]